MESSVPRKASSFSLLEIALERSSLEWIRPSQAPSFDHRRLHCRTTSLQYPSIVQHSSCYKSLPTDERVSIALALVLPTSTSTRIRPKHKQGLLPLPLPPFLPARRSLRDRRHFLRFSRSNSFILRCASGRPRRRRRWGATEDVLQLTRARREHRACPGRCRARQCRERRVRERRWWWGGWGLPALG